MKRTKSIIIPLLLLIIVILTACVSCDSSSHTENPGPSESAQTTRIPSSIGNHSPGETTSSGSTSHQHVWSKATCQKPQTCSICHATQGDVAEHVWQNATCEVPKTCSVCNTTEGSPLAHSFVNGVCSECQYVDKNSDDYKYALLKKKADSIAFSCAETVLRNFLKNPSTMKVLGEDLLDSDDYFRYHVRIHYSAQNNVGGTVTDYAEVLVRVNPEMDGTFYYTYNKSLGIKFPIFDDTIQEWGWGTEPDDWSLDAANKYSNPVEVSLKMILASPEKYAGQYVKIKETLVISSNYLSDKRFSVIQSTGSGKYDYNSDNRIDVFYRLSDNLEECIMLDADYQKITVIGEVKVYSNSTEAYIEATEIIIH